MKTITSIYDKHSNQIIPIQEATKEQLLEVLEEGFRQGWLSESETFTSINRWQDENFPLATVDGIWNHIGEEWIEFQTANTIKEQIIEAVDLIILLTGWIHKASDGRSAQEFVDAKMRVNRLRNWNIQPDGTGRHK